MIFLGLLLLQVALVQPNASLVQNAWWVGLAFDPAGTQIEGFPVSTLDKDWVAAAALREEMFPPGAREAGESLAGHGGTLSTIIDLDADRRPEKALVGIYRDKSGQVGRFLLVLQQGRGVKWQKRAVFKVSGEAGFSVLFVHNRRLQWCTCMECDGCCDIDSRDHRLELTCGPKD